MAAGWGRCGMTKSGLIILEKLARCQLLHTNSSESIG
jgi:hypothetical protein